VKPPEKSKPSNFVRDIIEEDLRLGTHDGRVATRFPPEPNGYLHIGHAKSICLNFGLAQEYGGQCHLRFDDTNPVKEDVEYVESIKNDVAWLGFDWGEHLYFASDYFEKMYGFAVELIKKGLAYVDSQSVEDIQENRGTVKTPGVPSPYRDRSVEENLDLFEKMRAGEFKDGEIVLRAKIDMGNANMLMRDPLLYRVRHVHHHRTGDAWCIYPMYDFAHCLEDAIEQITHSVCTLEFENNREVYDWLIGNVSAPSQPKQYEFARLNLNYTVMSKRKLLQLVEENLVSGWDDPRMPTIAGMRKRGIPPEAIRFFCEIIGVAKANSLVDVAMLEYAIRDKLDPVTPRVMCVLRPLKVTITNFPEDKVEIMNGPLWPENIDNDEKRPIPFTKTIFIEQGDFAETPPKKWKRFAPGLEVRLRHAYFIKCNEVVKNDAGEVVELLCTYDPQARGTAPDGRKPNGTLHWVSATEGVNVQARLYDRLFSVAQPDGDAEVDFKTHLNPDSLTVRECAMAEPYLKELKSGARVQFERQGFFVLDGDDSSDGNLVFNRITTLRDSWKKEPVKAAPKPKAKKQKPALVSVPQEAKVSQRDQVREGNPALAARFDRYQNDLGLSKNVADQLSGDEPLSNYFETLLASGLPAALCAKWLRNELLAYGDEGDLSGLSFGADAFVELLTLLNKKEISNRMAKEILEAMVKTGKAPGALLKDMGGGVIADDSAIEGIIQSVLDGAVDECERYKNGEDKLFGFFMGQVMAQTKGKADPKLSRDLLQKALAKLRTE
tara:strand:+ start:6241 stop:8574 length:2334 start_codon:yes stop_codon:yes gene_type:complete